MKMSHRTAEIDYGTFMERLNIRNKELGQNELKVLDEEAAKTYLVRLSAFDYDGDELKADDHRLLLCTAIQGIFTLAAASGLGPNRAAQKELVLKEEANPAGLVDEPGAFAAGVDADRGATDSDSYRNGFDLSIYRESDVVSGSRVSYGLAPRESSDTVSTPERHSCHSGKTEWSLMKSFIEVKKDPPTPSDDFSLEDPDFGTQEQETEREDSQIIEYVAKIRFRQHRVFLYAASVHRNMARLFYWDHAGMVFSEPLDYKANPYEFINFFYQLGQMDDIQLGLDPTVTPATADDEQLWTALSQHEDNERLRSRLDAVRREPLVRVEVNGDGLEAATNRWEGQCLPPSPTRTLLIGKHAFGNSSLTGRCTRGYIALDVEKQRFVYLKDYWRVEHERARPEMVTYARLHAAGVEYIPDIVCGGDVYSSPSVVQRTRSQEHLTGYSPHVHARIVIEQIGRRLNDYKNSHELVLVVRDAFRAHQQAWTKAKILHRDINDGNIIIDDTGSPWRARLIDWDQSKSIKDLNKGATNAVRSGTWAFMSGLLVRYPRKLYELSDDLESFLQLLLWMATRFHEQSRSDSPYGLGNYVYQKYFAIWDTNGGYRRGTESKTNEIRLGDLPVQYLHSPAFADLLKDLLQLFKTHYDQFDFLALETLYGYIPPRVRERHPAPDRKALVLRLGDAVKDSPLRDHDRMLAIFDKICQRNICFPFDTQTLPFDWDLSDKVEDQFKDIPEFLAVSSASTKRTGEASVDERESKRQKP